MGIHGVGEGDDEREDAREGESEDGETHCLGGGWLWWLSKIWEVVVWFWERGCV